MRALGTAVMFWCTNGVPRYLPTTRKDGVGLLRCRIASRQAYEAVILGEIPGATEIVQHYEAAKALNKERFQRSLVTSRKVATNRGPSWYLSSLRTTSRAGLHKR